MSECLSCKHETIYRFCTPACKKVYEELYGVYFIPELDVDRVGDGSKENPFKSLDNALEAVTNKRDYVIINMRKKT